MKNNEMNCVPLTQTWDQSLRNYLDTSLFLPHKGKISKNIAEGQGGGDGACRARFLGGEEGESTDAHIHHAS